MIVRAGPEQAAIVARRIRAESRRLLEETGQGFEVVIPAEWIALEIERPGVRIWLYENRGDDEEFERFLIWVDADIYRGTPVIWVKHVWAPSTKVRRWLRWLAEQLINREGWGAVVAAFPLGTPFADMAQGVVQGRTDLIPGHAVIRLSTAFSRLQAAGW